MDGLSQAELERALQSHFDDFLIEVHRRDEWLINSIWNGVRSIMALGFQLTALAVCVVTGYTAWWQVGLALVVGWIAFKRASKRNDQLEKADKAGIGSECQLGLFRF
jgi:hypothetical protein